MAYRAVAEEAAAADGTAAAAEERATLVENCTAAAAVERTPAAAAVECLRQTGDMHPEARAGSRPARGHTVASWAEESCPPFY